MQARASRNGFSFVEVMMAITVIAFSLGMLFTTQVSLIEQSAGALATWDAFVATKNLAIEALEQQEKPETNLQKMLDGFSLSYTFKKVDERSSLKNIKQLRITESEARWTLFGFPRSSLLIGARVIPETKEQAKQ